MPLLVPRPYAIPCCCLVVFGLICAAVWEADPEGPVSIVSYSGVSLLGFGAFAGAIGEFNATESAARAWKVAWLSVVVGAVVYGAIFVGLNVAWFMHSCAFHVLSPGETADPERRLRRT